MPRLRIALYYWAPLLFVLGFVWWLSDRTADDVAPLIVFEGADK